MGDVVREITCFKDLYKGERCYILGNGPSLRDIDLEKLKEAHTFGTNRIYLSGFTPEFYVCCNPLVLEQFKADIERLECVKFLSGANLDTSLRDPAFSSPEGPIWEGHTVTYVCLQLAFYMGFSEVVLVGVDHDYGALSGSPNEEQVHQGDDAGHFHPDYFKGMRWNLPDLGRSELAYSLAAGAYARAGRKVINASARTKLDVFPLAPFNHIAGRWQPKVTAIVSAYKGLRFLPGLFADLLGQTLNGKGQLEIVAACQEKTAEYEWLMSAPLPASVRVIATPDLPTVYAAWGLCARAAGGLYLTNANTDDRHHPRAYELMAQILDGRPGIDLVYHDSFITWQENQTYLEFVDENQGKEIAWGREPGKPGVYAWMDYSKAALNRACFIGPQPMWRASLHQRYGHFDPDYTSAGDYEFWLRCAGERNYYHLPQALGLYLASERGVELSALDVSAQESLRAWDRHQEPSDINMLGDTVALRVGGSQGFVSRDELLDMLYWIRMGGDPTPV